MIPGFLWRFFILSYPFLFIDIFSQVAVKALPYRDEFLCHLAAEEIETVDESFLSSLMNDMEVYLQHMNNIILVISQFYTAHNLDVEEQV